MGSKINIVSKRNILLFLMVYIQLIIIVALPTAFAYYKETKTMLVHNTILKLSFRTQYVACYVPYVNQKWSDEMK